MSFDKLEKIVNDLIARIEVLESKGHICSIYPEHQKSKPKIDYPRKIEYADGTVIEYDEDGGMRAAK